MPKPTMDCQTARRFLINQALDSGQNPDAFLVRLRQGEPPIPGQVTSILLALKTLFDALQGASTLDRELAHALYLLSAESRQQFEIGYRSQVIWPPLLDQDIARIARAVRSIFAGVWY